MAREAARKTSCSNNLKQIALATQQFVTLHQRFPSGGYGPRWVGDPDVSPGRDQPGGVFFSILPFQEQQSLYDWSKLAADPTKPKPDRAAEMIGNIVPGHSCLSRRAGDSLPAPGGGPAFLNATNPTGSFFRSDYVINGGTANRGADGKWGQANVNDDADPNNQIDDIGEAGWPGSDDIVVVWDYNPPTTPFMPPSSFKHTNGIAFQRSEVTTIQDIKDGASNTYLAGEKFMDSTHYVDGQDPGDRDPALSGGYGLFRWGHVAPMQDVSGGAPLADQRFGSAHSGVFVMVMADNSVREVSYDIDLATHKKMANGWDLQP
jgi:hypothetical protein